LFERAATFLSKPYELWLSGNLHLQKLVLRFMFADRLTYSRNEVFSTAKTSIPIKLLGLFQEGGMKMARHSE
jgi:hypothetical protein